MNTNQTLKCMVTMCLVLQPACQNKECSCCVTADSNLEMDGTVLHHSLQKHLLHEHRTMSEEMRFNLCTSKFIFNFIFVFNNAVSLELAWPLQKTWSSVVYYYVERNTVGKV